MVFVLKVTNFQLEHLCLPLILFCAQILIEGCCTLVDRFLALVFQLFKQIELVYYLGLGWVGLGVAVLSWFGDFVVMYMVLAV